MTTDPTPPSTASGGGLSEATLKAVADFVEGKASLILSHERIADIADGLRALAVTRTDAAAGWADITLSEITGERKASGCTWLTAINAIARRRMSALPSAGETKLAIDETHPSFQHGYRFGFADGVSSKSAGEAETGSGDPGRAAELTSAWRDYCRTRYGEHQPKSSVTAHFAAGFNAAISTPTAPPAPPVVEAGGDGLRDVSDWLHQPEPTGYAGLPESVRKALLAWSAALTPPPPASVAQAEEALGAEELDRLERLNGPGYFGHQAQTSTKGWPAEMQALVSRFIAAARASRVAGAEGALREALERVVASDTLPRAKGIARAVLGHPIRDGNADPDTWDAALARPSAAGTEGV